MKCVCEVNLYLSGSIDRGWVADPGFVWYFNVIVWFSAWRGLHVCSLNAAIHNWRDYILIYPCIGFNKSRLPVFYHRLKACYCRLLSLWAGSCVWFSRLAFTQLSYERQRGLATRASHCHWFSNFLCLSTNAASWLVRNDIDECL